MATHRTAAALACQEKATYPDVRVWIHSVSLAIPVANRQSPVPTITSKFIAAIRNVEPSVIIQTTNGDSIGDDDNIPREKTAFDNQFKCRMRDDRTLLIFLILQVFE